MNENESKTFQYIKLENEKNRYFCLQQHLWVVVWILFFKQNILRPVIRTNSTTSSFRAGVGWLRRQYGILTKNIAILIRFALYHYQLRGTHLVLELPCYGQFCVPVHQGWKIFDLRKEVVIKIFDHDVPAAVILGEVERLGYIAKIDFAPSIRRWNVEKRWYEEDYLNGSLDSSHKPMDSEALLTKFHDDVVHKLNALILFQEPKATNAVLYGTNIAKILESSRLSRQDSTVGELKRIQYFVDSIVARLKIEEDCPILLVFAHGDFVPANMLNTPHGMKMIDWEGAGYRSALFDFYSYFFYRSTSRNISVSTLILEVQKALPLFMAELAKKAQDVSESIRRMESVYRWIFYIEMLCRLIEREMSDKNLNVLYYISRYLEAFNGYEEILDTCRSSALSSRNPD